MADTVAPSDEHVHNALPRGYFKFLEFIKAAQ